MADDSPMTLPGSHDRFGLVESRCGAVRVEWPCEPAPPKRQTRSLREILTALCSPHAGRAERRRDRFRPMVSLVSSLSSIVANSHQVLPTVPPPSLIIPHDGFSPVRLETSPRLRTAPAYSHLAEHTQ